MFMKNGYSRLSFPHHFFRRFIAELGPMIITTFRFYVRFEYSPSSFTNRLLVTEDFFNNSRPDKISSEIAIGPVQMLNIIMKVTTNVDGLVTSSRGHVVTGKLT